PTNGSSVTVTTLGNNDTYIVGVSAYNAGCGYTDTVTTTVAIAGEEFNIIEQPFPNPNVNRATYYIEEAYSSMSWYNDHTAIWWYDGANVTDLYDYSTTLNTVPKGLWNTNRNGLFTVIVTNISNGCVTTETNNQSVSRLKQLTHSNSNGSNNTILLNNRSVQDMIISPNPVVQNMTIQMPFDSEVHFFLYSMNGTLVKQWQNHTAVFTVNISDLPNGTYIIIAFQDGIRYNKQIILNQ
ncbi:MAG: T9SS type A sorting domain-containing protein, partial [Bacteroidales bacterium]|nr:T9SS type A sorting domain-containing protein [Bacteroidales bacterium]